jgi:Bacterial archaeo-eukaryotic release factor family 7
MMRATITYMDPLGQTEWQTLLAERDGPCVSLFLPIQPTNVKGHDEPLRLRGLLALATNQLTVRGLSAAKVETLLQPAWALAKDDLIFWQEQSEGLALFLAPGFMRTLRLPITFSEKAVVSDHFFVRPLLPLLTGDGRFYLLTLSQNQVRLFQADRFTCQELTLPTIPHSLAEATQYDEMQPVRQVHSIASAGTGQRRRAVAFHGHGTAADTMTVKTTLHHFLQAVDRGVCAELANKSTPLVLAGTRSICGIYREVNRYPHLYAESIDGNPDRNSLHTLHERGWALVADTFQEPRTQALWRYQHWAGSHEGHAVQDLPTVVLAAVNQRVETLLITPTHEAWGHFEMDQNTVVIEQQPRPSAEELINLAVIHTLRARGHVYEVAVYELGESRGVAALLRY